MLRLPDAVWMIVVGLFGLSLLLFLSLQRPRRRTEDETELGRAPGRARRPSALLASLPILLLLIAFIYLAWTRWAPGEGHPLDAPLAAIAGLLELLAQARKPPTSVAAFDYAVAGLALLLALATFALMVLVVLAERVVRWWDGPAARRRPAPPLHAAVAESLDDLRAEPDARAAIIRAYRRFELALSAARVPRAAVADAGGVHAGRARPGVRCRRRPCERLTALFELARFSERPLGADARAAACDCLDEVKTALETEPTHAPLSPVPWRRPSVTRCWWASCSSPPCPSMSTWSRSGAPSSPGSPPRWCSAWRCWSCEASSPAGSRATGPRRSMPRGFAPAVEPGAPQRLLELTASVRAALRSRRHFEKVLWPRLTALATRPLVPPPLRRGRGPSLAGLREVIATIEDER